MIWFDFVGFLYVVHQVLILYLFVYLCEFGLPFGQLQQSLLILADGLEQLFGSLFVGEELGGEEVRLVDSGFDLDEVEGALDVRVLLDEGAHLALEQAVRHLVRQDYLPHVDVLLVEGVVELDALQLVRPLLPLLDELVPLLDVADPPRKVHELPLPQLPVLVVEGSVLAQGLLQLVQLLLLVDAGLLHHLVLLGLAPELLVPEPAELLVEDFVLLHAGDDLLEYLGLHPGVLVLACDFQGGLLLLPDRLLDLLPLLREHPVLLPHEVDLPPLQLHARQLPPAHLRHLVVVLPDRVQVLGHNRGLVQLARRTHLQEVGLVEQIFLGVVEPISFLDRGEVVMLGEVELFL